MAVDTIFVLAATILVFIMIPGLALFYGGLVSRTHRMTTILQVLVVAAAVSAQWVAFGYSLSFGPDVGHVIGGLGWAFFRHVGLAPFAGYSADVPHLVFAVFQMGFAAVTAAVAIGAVAERAKTWALVVFALVWTTLIYDPIAHWVWGQGGWLHQMGVLDFAGGTVVEINSGVAGLMAALVVGRRLPRRGGASEGPDLRMMLLGAAVLWFGWFGFNAGSALAANGVAVIAFLGTGVAAVTGVVGFLWAESRFTGHWSFTGAGGGVIAGLVAITPAAGFVTPLAAAAIGLIGGVVSAAFAIVIKERMGYDDTLDAFAGHGVTGFFGILATGIFAVAIPGGVGTTGLIAGNVHTFLVEGLAAVATAAFSAGGTWVIAKAVHRLIGLRVSAAVERSGLDAGLKGGEDMVLAEGELA